MDEGGIWKNYDILMAENERLKKENKELKQENRKLKERLEEIFCAVFDAEKLKKAVDLLKEANELVRSENDNLIGDRHEMGG